MINKGMQYGLLSSSSGLLTGFSSTDNSPPFNGSSAAKTAGKTASDLGTESHDGVLRGTLSHQLIALKTVKHKSPKSTGFLLHTHVFPAWVSYSTYRSIRGRFSSPETDNRWEFHQQSSGRNTV